jgi:hypothetical protein
LFIDLVSVWHWPPMGVYLQNVLWNRKKKLNKKVHFVMMNHAPSCQLLDYFNGPCLWMNEGQELMDEILHMFSTLFQL